MFVHRVLSIASVYFAVLGSFQLGCGDDILQQGIPRGTQLDVYPQTTAQRLDVLWVVDDSESMAPRQDNIARNFQNFIDIFSQSDADYRLAVTTTNVLRDKGALKGDVPVLSPKTPNVAKAFAANIRVGTNGSPFEAGLEAAAASIAKLQSQNAPALALYQGCIAECPRTTDNSCPDRCAQSSTIQFLRPGAFLSLIFVSDEEDKSPLDVRYYARLFEQTQGVGDFPLVSASAIIGQQGDNPCGASPGRRYLQVSQLIGGDIGNICDVSFADTLKRLSTNALGLRRRFSLTQKPTPGTLQVRLKYPCGASGEAIAHCAKVDKALCADDSAERQLTCTLNEAALDGWSYEPSRNAVFFQGVALPGPQADIQLEYRVEDTQ